MNEGLIPKRYAKALYKFACEKGVDAGIYNLMGTLGRSFIDNPDLAATVANPFVDDDTKRKLLVTAAAATDDSVKKPVADAYRDFLLLLSENKRLDLIQHIALAYTELYRKEHKIYRVGIVSAMPLDDKETARLKSIVEPHLNGGSAEYSFATDSSLIGGFTVDIDNERLDASVKNELKQLRLKLLHQA